MAFGAPKVVPQWKSRVALSPKRDGHQAEAAVVAAIDGWCLAILKAFSELNCSLRLPHYATRLRGIFPDVFGFLKL
jgi:hypothetical protein